MDLEWLKHEKNIFYSTIVYQSTNMSNWWVQFFYDNENKMREYMRSENEILKSVNKRDFIYLFISMN